MRTRQYEDSEVIGKTVCPRCRETNGDWDGDNLILYDDGHGYCFACDYWQSPEGKQRVLNREKEKEVSPLIDFGDHKALNARKLLSETCAFFNYTAGVHSNKAVQIAPYYDLKGNLVAQHLRYAGKDFRWRGDTSELQLFGQHKWAAGGRRLIVTEGEIDAMTISQIQNHKYPVVSIPSGVNTAARYLKQNLEYLEKFDEVVLAFDMDAVGQKAAKECAILFSKGKGKVAYLPAKDANEALLEGKTKELIDCFWRAETIRPDGIVNGKDLYQACRREPEEGLATPFKALDELTLGIRERELWLFTAGSGLGKSTLVNELGYHLHQVHNKSLGVIALEESPERNGRRYLGIHTNKLLHLPNHSISDEEYDKAFTATIGRGDWWIYDHFGSTDIEGLMAKIRYLAVSCEVKFLILDHISIVVSGLDESSGESERKTIDRLMTALRSLIEEVGLTILAVVHLKRPSNNSESFNEGGKVSLSHLRGSASLEQLSDVVIAIERDQQGDTPNKAFLRVLKNRPVGKCGMAGAVEYEDETGRLHETEYGEGASESIGFTDTTSTEEGNGDF